jgi:hypothetical protein
VDLLVFYSMDTVAEGQNGERRNTIHLQLRRGVARMAMTASTTRFYSTAFRHGENFVSVL